MKLADWMFDNGSTPASTQRALGLKSRATVGRYLRDEQVPEPPVMRKIETITGGQVRRKDFLDPSPPKCSVPVTLPNGKTVHILPWGRHRRLWETLAAKKKAPPLDGPPWQTRLAKSILGAAVKPLGKGLYLYNGRLIDARRLVALANRRRMQWGQEPIPYPGVNGGQVIDER